MKIGSVEIPITLRKLTLDFNREIPKYWYENDPFMTHYFNAFSITFPAGEKGFIDSIRFFDERITSKDLKDKMRKFISQEAMHSQFHSEYNRYLSDNGYQTIVNKYDTFLRKIIRRRREIFSPLSELGRTVASEHLTACFADGLLKKIDEDYQKMEPTIAKMWYWHLVEELEHKGVAHDVYKAVKGGYWLRVGYLIKVTIEVAMIIHKIQYELLKKDGFTTKQLIPIFWSGIRKAYGHNSAHQLTIKEWFRFFKVGFHPWNYDNSNLIQHPILAKLI